MQDLIDRLRAQKMVAEAGNRAKEESEAEERARRGAEAKEAGRRWAQEEATFNALTRLAEIQADPVERVRRWSGIRYQVGHAAKSFVQLVQPDNCDDAAIEAFWTARGPQKRPGTNWLPGSDYIRYFADGAVDVWKQVKDQI